MAKIYVTAASENQLDNETEIKIRAFKRTETRQVFDFQDTADWGVYDDSTGISATNSLSDAHAVNGYKEFEVEIPTLVHEANTVLQICDTTGSPIFAVYKDAKSLHCYNPGMSLVGRKTQIR